MPFGWLPLTVGSGYSVIVPPVVICATRPMVYSVNHRVFEPGGPGVMNEGPLPMVGVVNSVMPPAGVIWPILLVSDSVNQRLPSDPAAMLTGSAPLVGIVNSLIEPDVRLTRPILPAPHSVNQMLPSGPAVIPRG